MVRHFSPGLALISLLVFYFSSFYFYPIPGIKPLYLQLLFLAITAYWFILFPKSFKLKGSGSNALIVWCLTYTAFVIASFLSSSQSDAATQILVTWLKTPIFLVASLLIFSSKLKISSSNDLISAVLVIVALLAVAMNIYDFFKPTFSNVPGRAAGFYVNPNISGSVIAYAMTFGVWALPFKLRFPFAMLCGFGVFLTFSRGAWVVWAIGFSYFAWTSDAISIRRKIILGAGGSLVGLGALALLFSGALGQIVLNSGLSEYLTPNTMARLGIGAAQFSDHSASERALVAWSALEFGAEAPVFGQGLGFTREDLGWPHRASTHNMYLLFWTEGGLIGVLIFLSFLGIIWKYGAGLGRVLFIQMALNSLFTHNLLEWPVTAILVAYVVAFGDARRQRNPQVRKSVVRPLPA